MEVIKLVAKREFFTEAINEEVRTKFIAACVNLDASIFEPYINEEQYFEDLDKYRFLASLKQRFDSAKFFGNKTLVLHEGYCKGCIYGNISYQFYARGLYPEFSYIIYEKNEIIENIFVCNSSSGSENMQNSRRDLKR